MVTAQDIAKILGGPRTLRRRVTTMMDLDEIVSRGIPRSALDALINHIVARSDEGTRVNVRYKIIPRATYQRSDRLNAQYSETTERLARVFAIVQALWQDEEAVRRFMNTPHPELGGKTPLEAALTEIGGRQVEEIIERGMHGLPV